MAERKYGFSKAARLKRTKQIDLLFRTGKRIAVPGFMLYYHFHNDVTEAHALLLGVAVSARHFRKAVHRNRIKRLLREALRLQKHALEDYLLAKEKRLHIFAVYTGRALPDYNTVFSNIGSLLLQVQQRIDEAAS